MMKARYEIAALALFLAGAPLTAHAFGYDPKWPSSTSLTVSIGGDMPLDLGIGSPIYQKWLDKLAMGGGIGGEGGQRGGFSGGAGYHDGNPAGNLNLCGGCNLGGGGGAIGGGYGFGAASGGSGAIGGGAGFGGAGGCNCTDD